MGKGSSRKQKVILPPDLPPEIPDDDIEVSDEDLEFVKDNRDYAGFVSRLDTQSITKHITRVADVKEDALEAIYEKRLQRKALQKEKEKPGFEADAVESLPVKSLDGQLYYRLLSEKTGAPKSDLVEDETDDKSVFKLSKAERREKLKKSKRESKKQGKELPEEVQQAPQAAVLEEIKEDLIAEETFESKKRKLAELGMQLLAEPEASISSLKEMIQIAKDGDQSLVKLGLLSLLAVFKDIIPGYRIRLPTEKELEMKVSKDIKKMRFYESTLLKGYKAYLQKLLALERQPVYHQVVIRCLCNLLDAAPHFNYRENLLAAVVRNIGSADDVVRRLCCTTLKSLFANDAKHGGEVTIDAVRLIADHVKAYNCQLHPDSVEVFMSLVFDDDLGKPEKKEEDDPKNKKNRYKRRKPEAPSEPQDNDRKKSKREMVSKMREEVAADYKAAAFVPDVMERRRMQSDTLAAVFETYFRILKHALQSTNGSLDEDASAGGFGSCPLLPPCLDGLGKFSNLLDLDYVGDLMNYLKKLASCGNILNDPSSQKVLKRLTLSERLRCCIVAFKVMRNNLDALNVDLHDFFILLFNLILEYRPGRDQGEVLTEALKIMLCQDRHHDMGKTAAFIKRLATFSLCLGTAECMAALVTSKHLLQKNAKCRNLLENDAGGGSVSGSVAKYHPDAKDPNLSGALASVLWELNLLTKHYHPAVSSMATSILSINTSHTEVYLPTISPPQAFTQFSLVSESFNFKKDGKQPNKSKRRVSNDYTSFEIDNIPEIDEKQVSKKLADHFVVIRDIKEKERMRRELDHANSALQLYEEYKKQKIKARKLKSFKK